MSMTNSEQKILENEWSYLFSIDDLEKKPETLIISPDEDAKKRLAQRLGIVSLDDLQADLKITRASGSMIVHIEGKISADLTQSCVVTLDDIPARVEDEFEAWYADTDSAVSLAKAKHERASKGGHSEVRMLEEEDDPEKIIDGKIDLGELVTQYLSLSINPYPHAEGIELATDDAAQEQVKIDNPFAALKDWKSKIDKPE